jgi:hypothetical protein
MSLLSQDLIITKKNDTIRAKILKEYDMAFEYALFNNQEDSTVLILKTEINAIIYKNGNVKSFKYFTADPIDHAQNNSDIIRMVKRGTGYVYYKGNAKISFTQAMQLTS